MMSDTELIQMAAKLKEEGNTKFKAKLFDEAEGLYKEAIAFAENVNEDSEELVKLKVTIL